MPDPFFDETPGNSHHPDSAPHDAELFEDGARGKNTFEPATEYSSAGYQPVWVQAPRTRNRVWLHWLLFAITVATTTLVGFDQWLAFRSQFGYRLLPRIPYWVLFGRFWAQGLWYGATIMVILGAHELGHYFACRYYRVDASPPYFIPLIPGFGMTGTLGAFIRIRQPIRTKRVLFDIGIAGPLAGFVFAVPALFIGLALSNVARVPPRFSGLELGEPLIFKLASWLFWGRIPEGYSVNLHPMAFAAWFGLLATVLNLFPVGQLDGGHIAYTVLGRRSALLTRVMVAVILALTLVSLSWLMWAVLLVVMLMAFGASHPPTLDEDEPLDRTRVALVVVACIIFVLCFTPAPIQPLDLIR